VHSWINDIITKVPMKEKEEKAAEAAEAAAEAAVKKEYSKE